MAESAKLSRRDWFRLRVPHQNRMLDKKGEPHSGDSAEKTIQSNSAGLKPIEHPPNHDGLDLSELPPMREATLSVEEVNALFDDIAQLGSDVLLMQRMTGAQRADASKADTKTKLDVAKSSLLSGKISRLQVRYHWQDQQWIDTLKREIDGFHIVRIAHAFN